MTSVVQVALGDLMATKTGAVDPSKYAVETFDLYSIPAYDRGEPEVARGSAIGSSKQIVEPHDVLLSKIVPHIRRTWVVGEDRGRRLIASGEWIVFRNPRVEPGYLRQVLRSDPFHVQFVQTVAGVGGSLLRARPAQVARIEIPLPPLPEQRRIAAILDQADALRAKRREALAQLDSLTQSIFIEMFGDPVVNSMQWPQPCLDELIDSGPQNGLYKPSTDYGSGSPILRIDAFYNGAVTKMATLKRVRVSADELRVFGLSADDVVINRVNSIEYLGKSALIPALQEPTVFESNLMRFKLASKRVLPKYFVAFLQTTFIKEQIRAASKDAVNQSSINQQDVKAFKVSLPPVALQQTFATRIQAVDSLKTTHRAALTELDALFASLQHRAFAGTL